MKMVPHTAAAASAIFSSSVSSKSNKNRAASVVVSVAVGSKVFQGGDEIGCDDQQQITQELREGVARHLKKRKESRNKKLRMASSRLPREFVV